MVLCVSVVVAGLVPQSTALPAVFMYHRFGYVIDLPDGDTVKMDFDDDAAFASVTIRLPAVQAIEMPANPDRARVCHAERARSRLGHLVGSGRVRASSERVASKGTRDRLLRFLAVGHDDQWRDVGKILVAEGLVLWRPSRTEPAKNLEYHRAAERAVRRNENLWNHRTCVRGPQDYIPIRLRVSYDPPGDDRKNLNGEWVRITNRHHADGLNLSRWYVRDGGNRRFVFPKGTRVPPGRSLTLHVGKGRNTKADMYWGRSRPVFVNPANNGLHMGDGAYLFDRNKDLRAHQMYPCVLNC